ncbi:unnamed protein product [Lampetra planeri]
MPPDRAAAVLAGTRSGEAAISPQPPAAPQDVPAPHRRLPLVREFTAAGGDWEAFQCRFSTSCTLAGWTQDEALKALPTSLALAVFYAIPPVWQSMLSLAFKEMAAIHDPPSSVRNRFMERRTSQAGTVLAHTSAMAVEGDVIGGVEVSHNAGSAQVDDYRIGAREPLGAAGCCSFERPAECGAANSRPPTVDTAALDGEAATVHQQ